MCEAILQNKPGLVEGDEGKKNIDMLSALYESAACGREAKAPGCKIVKSKDGEERQGQAAPELRRFEDLKRRGIRETKGHGPSQV